MIIVIDYQAGNLHNVGRALRYLGAHFRFSGDPAEVTEADGIILPGVGSARAAMNSLAQLELVEALRTTKAPFLGICLGLQLLLESSDEESTPCLGVFRGRVRRFEDPRVKVPHIGWNRVWQRPGQDGNDFPLFRGIPDHSFFYFLHSYYATLSAALTRGITEYSVSFSSAFAQDNFWGVQFHPELSGDSGLRLLKNFVDWVEREKR